MTALTQQERNARTAAKRAAVGEIVPRELLSRHLEEIGEYAWDTFDELRALLGKESQ